MSHLCIMLCTFYSASKDYSETLNISEDRKSKYFYTYLIEQINRMADQRFHSK